MIGVFLSTVGLGFIFGIALMLALRENRPMFIATSPFVYSFSSNGTLQEKGSITESSSPYFWLNSGAMLSIDGGTGATVQGALSTNNYWRLLYGQNNPLDTDSGYHPQNLFRLVTKSDWENISQEAQFYIQKDHLSASPNRNQSNGLLLMNRYRDNGQTLYYAGIRVDGYAVIKKKYKGTYYTMATKQIFPGTYSISGTGSRNLLPHNEWVSLRTTTVTNSGGTVTVKLFMKREGETTWKELLAVTDTGQNWNTPITGPSAAGIRTDFMDVKFDNYQITNI